MCLLFFLIVYYSDSDILMILQSIFICCLSYKLCLCIWKLQSISEPLIIVNEEKKSIIWQRWIYLAANVNDVIQKSSVSSDLIYVTRWLLHGLKHTVTAKPDSISHQTHCKCIRYIIFSPSTSDLLSLSFFSFSSPSLSLFFFTTVPFEESMLFFVLISLFDLLHVLNDAQGPQCQNNQEEARIRGLENLSLTFWVFVLQ